MLEQFSVGGDAEFLAQEFCTERAYAFEEFYRGIEHMRHAGAEITPHRVGGGSCGR